MKILLIDHAKKHFRNQDIGRWHFLPTSFEKSGHKVLHVTKNKLKKFYPLYLRFKPDVIISTGLVGVIPILFKKLGLVNKPIIHDWNDYYDEIFGRRIGIDRAAFLERYIIKNSDFITTPSKYLQQKADSFGRKVIFIQHGTSVNLKIPSAKLNGKLKLLYIGEQTPYKRVDRILDAVKGMSCDLYLVGDPNKSLQKNAPKNAHFIGRIPHKEIGKYLKAVDIGVVTADQENLKLWEYAIAGKPILAYKGRIGYFLTHMQDSYLCEDFREGVKALQNKKLRQKLAKNIKAIPFLSWNKVSENYLKFLNKRLKKSNEG